jgi:hypothetical protein
VEILDDRHLLFQGTQRDQVWLNILQNRCPGLRRHDTLVFRMTGNRLCSLDTAEVVIDPPRLWRRSGPSCSLGEFHRLTEEQVRLLRQAT